MQNLRFKEISLTPTLSLKARGDMVFEFCMSLG